MGPYSECLKKCLKCLKPLGLAAAARVPPIDASISPPDAAAGGGALILIMLETELYQKWVPSLWIWRKKGKHLDYRLGRPHLVKSGKQVLPRGGALIQKTGVFLENEVGAPSSISQRVQRAKRSFRYPPGDPLKRGGV